MKVLKKTNLFGSQIKATRLRRTENSASSSTSYDEFEDNSDIEFDKLSIQKLLKDYLHADPSMRYQIGKNEIFVILLHSLHSMIVGLQRGIVSKDNLLMHRCTNIS